MGKPKSTEVLFVKVKRTLMKTRLVQENTYCIDAYPTTYRRPAVPYQAISVANGLQTYKDMCTACHGIGGFGDGPAGTVGKFILKQLAGPVQSAAV